MQRHPPSRETAAVGDRQDLGFDRARGHVDDHGHSHAHDHDHPRHEVTGDVRRTLRVATGLLLAAALVGLAVWWPGDGVTLDREALGFGDRVQATVTGSETAPCDEQSTDRCLTVTARVDSGADAGDTATIQTVAEGPTQLERLVEGDEIVLNDAGTEVPPRSATRSPTCSGRPR